MSDSLSQAGACIDAIYYCPHELEPACDCRKPAPGMLLNAARSHGIELSSSWMIGDSDIDVEAGRNAGCKTARLLADADSQERCHSGTRAPNPADIVAASLLDAVRLDTAVRRSCCRLTQRGSRDEIRSHKTGRDSIVSTCNKRKSAHDNDYALRSAFLSLAAVPIIPFGTANSAARCCPPPSINAATLPVGGCRRFSNTTAEFPIREIENVNQNSAIEHPSVRACLKYLGVEEGVEIHHVADLPARTGLGTSSAFTVGLLLGLYALRDQMRNKHALASDAIHVEQEVIREAVGSQDQISAAYGGFNRINFNTGRQF